MPIDYSKFDNIGSDDDDEKDSSADVMQQCLRLLGERASNSSERSNGFGDGLFSRPEPPYALDPGAPDPFADDPMFGDGFGDANSSRPIDFEALRKEAFQVLLVRLVCRPSAESIARALLLDAELDLLACRYHRALVNATALQLATSRGHAQVGRLDRETQRVSYTDVSGVAEEWAAPALVIEMVAAYQLGDREHAVVVRDRLKEMQKESMSLHLQKRFDGTSEILELVPQLLGLLKASEAESSSAGGQAISDVPVPRRRR
jgi:hypothetical protein